MKILCPIKRVIDYQVNIRVKSDQSGVETENVPMAINPFDEIALEQAITLKEQAVAASVIAVSIGDVRCNDVLRKALAFGVDEAYLIETEHALSPVAVARCLQACVQRWQPDCVLMGKQAIDDDCNQTGQYLAGLLDWPQATFASHIEFTDGDALVTREVDGGLLTCKMKLPAVITTDLRLNEPRFLSLPNIIKAKQKNITVIACDALGIDTRNQTVVTEVSTPPKRAAGIRVQSAGELLAQLREKGVLV